MYSINSNLLSIQMNIQGYNKKSNVQTSWQQLC